MRYTPRSTLSMPPPRQAGAVLFVGLILLLILTMIGVTVARMQTVEERMAQNAQNQSDAMQIAEAALRATEWVGLSTGGWSPAVMSQNANGFYTLNPNNGSVVPTVNWMSAAQVATLNSPQLPWPGHAWSARRARTSGSGSAAYWNAVTRSMRSESLRCQETQPSPTT